MNLLHDLSFSSTPVKFKRKKNYQPSTGREGSIYTPETKSIQRNKVHRNMSKFVIPTALKELRFHLSQTGEASVPLRKFLTTNYSTLKQQTEYKLPILIRESYGIPPSLTARFERGEEVRRNLEGLSEGQVAEALNEVLKR